MSRHIVVQEEKKYVFGWDQPLMSFYLQVHDTTRAEDDQIIVWLGATANTKMYEVEDLVHAAHKHGLWLSHEARVALYGEKDDGV
jgi:copper oxidase (laccase) domain-containing protein